MPFAPLWADLVLVVVQVQQSRAARVADYVLGAPLRILLIVVVAVVIRFLLLRAISRFVDRAVSGHAGPLTARLPGRAKRVIAEVTPGVAERRTQRVATLGSVLRSIASFVVFSVAGADILAELGINLAPIVASAGIIGVAVGFGAQNLVRDFLTGMFMILEDQYGVGDIVDVGPATGTVEAVGLRSTRLRDVEGVVWHVRNGEITRIGNMSQGWSRALLDVGVSYGSDLARAKEVLKATADALWQDPEYADLVYEEPALWGVQDLAPDGVTLRLVVKTAPQQQFVVARALRERIKDAFDAAGVEIPVPQRAIWVRGDGPAPLPGG